MRGGKMRLGERLRRIRDVIIRRARGGARDPERRREECRRLARPIPLCQRVLGRFRWQFSDPLARLLRPTRRTRAERFCEPIIRALVRLRQHDDPFADGERDAFTLEAREQALANLVARERLRVDVGRVHGAAPDLARVGQLGQADDRLAAAQLGDLRDGAVELVDERPFDRVGVCRIRRPSPRRSSSRSRPAGGSW